MKTIYNNIKIICLAAFCGMSSLVQAQEEQTNEDLLNREMTLEREYDPSVQDANKVNILPVVKEPEVRKMPIDYASYAIPAEAPREISLLPSGRIMTDMLYNKRRGYFNFGGGTYLNLNGDVGYHILSTEKDQLNIFFSHRSTNGKVKYLQRDEKIKAKLNDNLGGVNYRHSFDKAALKLGAKYGYTSFNYYGYPIYKTRTGNELYIGRNFNEEENQGNQQIRLNLGVESHEGESVGYLFDIDYTNFSQKFIDPAEKDGITEHTIGAKLGMNAGFGGNQLIGVEGKLNYYSYGVASVLDMDYDGFAEITVTPYYKAADDNWNVKLGANVMYITGNESKFFVSPNIAADIEVADKTLLYLNAGGGVGSNSLYELSNINRYVSPMIAHLPSRNWLDAELGIKSGVAPGFWFNVFAGYRITDRDQFFVQTYDELGGTQYVGNVSGIVPMNSKVFRGGVELKYDYQKFFDIRVKGVYNSWNVTNKEDILDDPKAYGKPELEFNAGLDIRPINKLTLAFDYYLATGRYSLYDNYQTMVEEKLNNISELNVTGTYTLNDTFGVYVKLNNLLFQKYEMLYGYPYQKFGAMIGVNINF